MQKNLLWDIWIIKVDFSKSKLNLHHPLWHQGNQDKLDLEQVICLELGYIDAKVANSLAQQSIKVLSFKMIPPVSTCSDTRVEQ